MSRKAKKMDSSTLEEVVLRALKDLDDKELKEFKWYLQKPDFLGRLPIIQRSRLDKADRTDTVDQMLQTYCEKTLEVTKKVLRKLDRKDLVQILIDPSSGAVVEDVPECQKPFKSSLIKKFQSSADKVKKGGKNKVQDETYTEISLVIEQSNEISQEHDVQQIEAASRKPARPDKTIRYRDIFKLPPGRNEPIRTVMTKGVAGIGKTVLTQKFTLDWAEDKANQDLMFTFPLTFRELNVLKDKKFSLVGLVHHFFTETKEICSFEDFQVVFIFDGLDECRLPLDFHSNETLTDVTESTSVDVLLTNLIRGKLLPSARLWITTRPAAANQIPPDCVGMVTEVRGFNESQKLDYFRKLYRDENLVSKIMPYIKKSQSLHIMCHIPVFCWITATVLEDMLDSREEEELPKTLTELFIYFLVIQSKLKGGIDSEPQWNQPSKEKILALGKLAFQQLQKGNLIFYEKDLNECDINARSVSVYTGMFTEIFKEEAGLHQNKVFYFIHSSVQEFLAALYVHLTFVNTGDNLFEEQQGNYWMPKLARRKSNFHQTAVDRAIYSPNGHLDLFLRFLLGLSSPTCQNLLKGLQTGSSLPSDQEAIKCIKERLDSDLSAERSLNLFHCLNELNDRSLVDEIRKSLSSGSLSTNKLTPGKWSALVFILLSSEKDWDTFDLRKYSNSEEGFLKLLPVVKVAKRAILSSCNLSEKSLETLCSILSSKSSHMKELDLSNNKLEDSGVKKLSAVLESSKCSLDILRLAGCRLTWRSCDTLASVISAKSSNLKELDVSNNDLQDAGVQLLSAGLENKNCTLEILRLSGCQVTDEGCASLASALMVNPSHLKELDLSYNHPGNSGKKMLSGGLKDRQCRLEALIVDNCGEERLKDGLKKYGCQLEVDQNTTHRNLKLSDDGKRVTVVREEQPYPDHPERFDHCCWQVLCKNAVTGRGYWEVEREGSVVIAVSYKRISRKGSSADCRLGWNHQCWSLICAEKGYTFWHNKRETVVPYSPPESNRVAVYVDCPAGTVSFYKVTSDNLTHLHTFYTAFTGPVFPAFGFGFGYWSYDASVVLCEP